MAHPLEIDRIVNVPKETEPFRRTRGKTGAQRSSRKPGPNLDVIPAVLQLHRSDDARPAPIAGFCSASFLFFSL
jgi:hypothetical protein